MEIYPQLLAITVMSCPGSEYDDATWPGGGGLPAGAREPIIT